MEYDIILHTYYTIEEGIMGNMESAKRGSQLLL